MLQWSDMVTFDMLSVQGFLFLHHGAAEQESVLRSLVCSGSGSGSQAR